MLAVAAALGDRGGHVLGRAIARHARDLRWPCPRPTTTGPSPGSGRSATVEATRYHIGSHRYIDESGLCDDAFHARFEAAEGGVGTAVALSAAGRAARLDPAGRPAAGRGGVGARPAGRARPPDGDAHRRQRPDRRRGRRRLGLADHRAGLLPADKARHRRRAGRRHGPTGMVGDGVNDAPALAAARVSVAMGGIASAAALEAADVVLMADDLAALPWLVRHSRRTLAVIRQNIALAVGAKLLVLALAVLGLPTSGWRSPPTWGRPWWWSPTPYDCCGRGTDCSRGPGQAAGGFGSRAATSSAATWRPSITSGTDSPGA